MTAVIQTILPAGLGPMSWLLRGFGAALGYAAYERSAKSAAIVGGVFGSMVALSVLRQNVDVVKTPKVTPVPAGKIRICVSGYTHSAPTAKARYLATLIAEEFPDKFETWFYFSSSMFFNFTAKKFANVDFPAHLKGHATSPFVWLETGSDNVIEPLGGAEFLSAWALDAKNGVSGSAKVKALAELEPGIMDYINGTSFHATNGKGKAQTA
jgi:hypothetical protein